MNNYINYLKVGLKENYVSYSDTDNTVDYFNGMILNLARTIEYLKKDGGKTIQVFTDGETDAESHKKSLNRIAKIAKAAGYKNKVTVVQKHNEMNGLRHEWAVVEGQLIKQ